MMSQNKLHNQDLIVLKQNRQDLFAHNSEPWFIHSNNYGKYGPVYVQFFIKEYDGVCGYIAIKPNDKIITLEDCLVINDNVALKYIYPKVRSGKGLLYKKLNKFNQQIITFIIHGNSFLINKNLVNEFDDCLIIDDILAIKI